MKASSLRMRVLAAADRQTNNARTFGGGAMPSPGAVYDGGGESIIAMGISMTAASDSASRA